MSSRPTVSRLLVLLWTSHVGIAAAGPAPVAASPRVDPGTSATWYDVSPPLREMAAAELRKGPVEPGAAPPGIDLLRGFMPFAMPFAPGHDHAMHAGLAPARPPVVPQGSLGTAAMPATIANFDGPNNLCTCLPPTPVMAVGPNHVMVMTTNHFTIFDKDGNTWLGPVPNRTIWSGFGASCEVLYGSYPWVIHDQLADRWVVSMQSIDFAPYGLCVAVSTSGDPTGSWHRWHYSTGSQIADSPRLGLWPNAYFLASGLFTNLGAFLGTSVRAFDRAAMLAGSASPAQLVVTLPADSIHVTGSGLTPADLDGNVPPPAGSPGLLLTNVDGEAGQGATQDALLVWRFHTDFTTPSNSSFTLTHRLTPDPFDSTFPCSPARNCIPQPGTTAKLDFHSGQPRFMSRVSYRNMGTHQVLLANRSVEAAPSMAGIRWYEVRDPHGTPFIHQQGTYAPGIGDGVHRWNGAIAMDHDGNIGLGYTVSSATVFPGIRYTGRLAGDPLGTLPQGEGTLWNGTGSQTATSGRWGDYSAMAIDPADDCTFWHVNEYYATTSGGGWRTRVGSFKYASCTSVGVEEGSETPTRTELIVSGPAHGQAVMVLALAPGEPRRVALDVFDVSGRRVRRVYEGTHGPGRYRVTWDGRDAAGTRVGPGAYFARLRAGDAEDAGTVFLR